MKRILIPAAAGIVLATAAGCSSPSPSGAEAPSSAAPPPPRVAEILREGGLVAAGTGEAANPQLALAKAKIDARKKLARSVRQKLDELASNFAKEAGDLPAPEIDRTFRAAADQLAVEVLKKPMGFFRQYDEKEGGATVARVLMMLDAERIEAALRYNAAPLLYERFQASKTFSKWRGGNK